MEKGLSMKRIGSLVAVAALAGAVLFFASLLGFGALLEGYSHTRHPVSLLGASGVPRALAFNLLAYVIPGVMGVLVAIHLRARLPAGSNWWSRLGTQLLLLSAVGLVAMGLLPLDPQDLESAASRLHSTAWSGWVVAFVAGAAALAIGLRRDRAARGVAWASGAAAWALLFAAFVLSDAIGAGMAQRLVFVVWFGWFAYAARRTSLTAQA